jgi:hypothetical protein
MDIEGSNLLVLGGTYIRMVVRGELMWRVGYEAFALHDCYVV